MKILILYFSLFPMLFICPSCITIFGWEKASKTSTKVVKKVPPSLRVWEKTSRDSAKLAPLPEKYKEAVIQVYAAPLWGLRGKVADHTWLSTKAKGASSYTVYEVSGWRTAKGYDSVLRIEKDIPDRLWYGNKPRVLLDLRGQQAEQIIGKIHKAALLYPYKKEYVAALGPNSNTFTAWILCHVPELNLTLSRRAIGKNYLKNCRKK